MAPMFEFLVSNGYNCLEGMKRYGFVGRGVTLRPDTEVSRD